MVPPPFILIGPLNAVLLMPFILELLLLLLLNGEFVLLELKNFLKSPEPEAGRLFFCKGFAFVGSLVGFLRFSGSFTLTNVPPQDC